MNTQTERERFEAWVLRAWVTPVWIERADLAAQGDRLTYCERKTRDVWEGWQARASQGDAQAERRDAERYRLLRNSVDSGWLDAAIDAAIASKGEPK